MTITNSTTGVWVNADGLRIKFGATEATVGTAGEFREGIGNWHLSEFFVTFSQVALGTDATHVYILDYDTVLPDTAVIDNITFTTGTAWATDTAINFGIVKRSDFTTIVDADGLVDSLVLAARDLAGETTSILGSAATYAGALMGVQAGIGFDGVVCTYFEGSAPTAGTGRLRIYWRDSSSN